MPDLLQHNILIDLDVSIPLGVTRGKPDDVHLTDVEMPKEVFGLVKRYLPRGWTGAHRTLVGKALRLIDTHASPVIWPMGKARFLMPNAVLPLVEGLRGIKVQFDEATEAKVDGAAYAEMRTRVATEHPQFREALERCFPDVATMKRWFRFDWHLFEVVLPRVMKMKATNAVKLDAQQKVLVQEAEKARATIATFYQQHVEVITHEVQAVCVKVADRVAKGEIVTEATLDSVANKLRWFKRMCGMVDPTAACLAMSQVSQLRTLLGATLALDVRTNSAMAAGFQAALTRAADAVVGMADVVRQPGRFLRSVARED